MLCYAKNGVVTLAKIKLLINIILIAGLCFSITMPAYAEGKFSLTIEHDSVKDHEQYAKYMEKKGTFRRIIKALNATLNIPYNIPIIMTNDDIGPNYDPETKTITLDYGDITWSADQYDEVYPHSDKETREYFLNNINLFSLYHELGHALIDAYNIPLVGSEEDAADGLASVMILYYFTMGDQIILDNAFYFGALRKESGNSEDQYWDEHALNGQRYYRLLCYAYGKSPQYVAEQLKETGSKNKNLDEFIEEKKDSCLGEYHVLNQAWFTLLKPHFKNSKEADKAIQKINEEDDSDDSDDDSANDEDSN
jgi:hypothetical protein